MAGAAAAQGLSGNFSFLGFCLLALCLLFFGRVFRDRARGRRVQLGVSGFGHVRAFLRGTALGAPEMIDQT